MNPRPQRPAGALIVPLAGTEVVLLPQRALWWPDGGTLLVADVHLGKAATLRHAGIGVPAGTGAQTLALLDQALQHSAARRLIVLGDLVHARSGRTPALDALVAAWRARHAGLEWQLVVGNHDARAGLARHWPDAWEMQTVAAGARLGPFVLHHQPGTDPAGYVLCGHLHPAVRLHGRGRDRVRLPCFWLGRDTGVLPAFGAMTGHAEVKPQAGDRIFVLAQTQSESHVLALPSGAA